MWLNKTFLITFSRFLLFAFFTLHSFLHPLGYIQKAVIIVLSSFYLSAALVNYFYPPKLRGLNDYMDFVFLLPLVLLSGNPLSAFAFLMPSAFNFPKNPLPVIFSVLFATAFSVYFFGLKGLLVFPLALALSLSPSSADLFKSVQRERGYFLELRKAYRSLQRELSAFEREKKDKERLLGLFQLLDSKEAEEYLKGVKKMFQLKAIKVMPLKDILLEEFLTDQTNLTLSVPVRLEEGNALVVFYLNHPAELMDRELRENLIRCAKLLNLYIAGFEGKEQAVKLAV